MLIWLWLKMINPQKCESFGTQFWAIAIWIGEYGTICMVPKPAVLGKPCSMGWVLWTLRRTNSMFSPDSCQAIRGSYTSLWSGSGSAVFLPLPCRCSFLSPFMFVFLGLCFLSCLPLLLLVSLSPFVSLCLLPLSSPFVSLCLLPLSPLSLRMWLWIGALLPLPCRSCVSPCMFVSLGLCRPSCLPRLMLVSLSAFVPQIAAKL